MYYVPDGTKECGYYECKKCGNRFLSMQTMKRIPCPDCEAEIDYEIGPDESLEDVLDTAELIQKIEGEEEVEKMDTLLSLALTGPELKGCVIAQVVSRINARNTKMKISVFSLISFFFFNISSFTFIL